jgi:NTE family protein
MDVIRNTVVLLMVVLAGLSGCAHYPLNQPKEADSNEGYYYRNQVRTNNSDELLVLLAFSGGGTRAASFSYGLMEALRDTTFEVDGKQRRLLDEVDVISSVSGGSFTAAAYALYGDRMFELFEPSFLKRNIQRTLFLKAINPIHWPALSSGTYNWSDLAAEYYDDILFKEACFNDLLTNNTPYIVINGTDISTGNRFSFNQPIFDIIASDVGSYPISRAVAASSAVPGALSPISLKNYTGLYPVAAPAWVTKEYGSEAGQARVQGMRMKSYLNTNNCPYIHLSDGGVVDNLGLRTYMDVTSILDDSPELRAKTDEISNIRKVVLIVVNSAVKRDKGWGKSKKPPGNIPVAVAASTRMMERYTEDTILGFNELVRGFKERQGLRDKVEFYSIDLDFMKVREPSQLEFLLTLPTSFVLKNDVVDGLKLTARTLLYDNEDFKKLAASLDAKHPAVQQAQASHWNKWIFKKTGPASTEK